ncbi:hypothetical protein M426DRAFT_11079 [Hypoxylon sp. CI-4A]|nr:hypothetical protein M426DRAFT_11079 [Hypoxylon sp. CI-4A]
MRFLITTDLPSFKAEADLSTYLHFADPSSDKLSIPLTSSQTVDVWICAGDEVTGELIDQWVGRASHIPKSILVKDGASIPRLQEYAKGRLVEIAEFPESKHKGKSWEVSILREAELLYARARAQNGIQQNIIKNHDGKTTVLLVGAGIVNLITAEYLVSRGYRVRVVDTGPDPRVTTLDNWARLGVTSGGGNARMFTHTEADNYNETGNVLYQNMLPIFRRTTRNGGWSVKPPQDFTPSELDWVNAFERIPAWMAETFKENIHAMNQASGKLWNELIKSSPHLFEGVEFHRDIVRLYVEQVALDVSIKLNGRLGSLIDAPSPKEFLNAYPGFRSAAESDHLAGGITVDGFTVNVHTFMAKLIQHITDLGGEFRWNSEVQGLQRNSLGEVTALDSQHGQLVADHYVLSPGMSGNAMLKGTASENLLNGVLGIWLQIPNLEPKLQNSMKIHRKGHLVEDINVTVAKDKETGEDILIFGGAYGYVGQDRPAHDSPELAALFDEMEQVANIYFPKAYSVAKERGSLFPGGHKKYCIRPFTPTGLGLFERIPTASGGELIITGGNNTGGFAQAPGIARAVWRAFVGEQDPMHVLFHPDRGRLPSIVSYKSRFPESLPLSSPEAQKPLRVLLLCSDGPQHRYLRYRLDQAFPGYRCIVETDDGQLRQLVSKRRFVDAAYMKYHGLRRQWAGHKKQRQEYFNRLVPQDYSLTEPDLIVDTVNSKPVWDAVEEWQPELTIVSGTKFIGKKLIARAGLMINLHTGNLPDYKGNHCIFFALYDGAVDKVSSTLHQLTSLLDGGDVLDRVFPTVLPGDNEESLYTRSMHMAMDRAIKHAELFSKGNRLEFVKQETTGRTFRHRDRTLGKEVYLWWRIRVGGLLRNYGAVKPVESG